MKKTIQIRELFVLDTADGTVSGTYHKACDEIFSPKGASSEEERIGVLFLNSLTPTRSATGDSAVYWADSFAVCGYPALRIDLAGLGDSTGDPPSNLLEFINTGGYASQVTNNITQLLQRFRLSGFVVVGLCAGAVSAIYTAAGCKECQGVILMDPYFHLPLANASTLWTKLIRRLSRGSIGRRISSVYDRVRAFHTRLTGVPLPPNANLPLLSCWKSIASAGTPILILTAEHTKLKIGDFDYLHHILKLAGPKSQVVIKAIKGTGHSFANRVGRAAIRQNSENWLKTYFSQKNRNEANGNIIPSEVDNDSANNQHTETCPQT